MQPKSSLRSKEIGCLKPKKKKSFHFIVQNLPRFRKGKFFDPFMCYLRVLHYEDLLIKIFTIFL